MNFAVHIEIRGLDGIADPEGKTIERALPALGFEGVADVRVGKVVRFVLDAADEDSALEAVESMCRQILANPVIERTDITIERVGNRP